MRTLPVNPTKEAALAILVEMEAAFGRPPTPEEIVAAAAAPAHALHRAFTWDDEAAIHEMRVKRARGIIQSATATVTYIKKT
jgi:transcriptional regulator GlxA family with amidase domain